MLGHQRSRIRPLINVGAAVCSDKLRGSNDRMSPATLSPAVVEMRQTFCRRRSPRPVGISGPFVLIARYLLWVALHVTSSYLTLDESGKIACVMQ